MYGYCANNPVKDIDPDEGFSCNNTDIIYIDSETLPRGLKFYAIGVACYVGAGLSSALAVVATGISGGLLSALLPAAVAMSNALIITGDAYILTGIIIDSVDCINSVIYVLADETPSSRKKEKQKTDVNASEKKQKEKNILIQIGKNQLLSSLEKGRGKKLKRSGERMLGDRGMMQRKKGSQIDLKGKY